MAPRSLSSLDLAYLRWNNSALYRDLDIELTLDYMRRRFVAPLRRHLAISDATLVDCAAGLGWLSFAFLQAGGKRAILVDTDEPLLGAAADIAKSLGLYDRCRFRVEPLQRIALGDDGADIFATVETLEHVGRPQIRPSVRNLARIARQAVILTTPNALFPVVAHDTELPFAHWLPAGRRHFYATALGRADLDQRNQFVAPWELTPLIAKFRPVSRFQTFLDGAEFDRFYPHYAPYGRDNAARFRRQPKRAQRALHTGLAATMGRWSFLFAPNLASIWLRR
jgi:2-polyprenyl-3-methyl-5-hydroxy-6-metoxy-1,4-benzoquinol methylase